MPVMSKDIGPVAFCGVGIRLAYNGSDSKVGEPIIILAIIQDLFCSIYSVFLYFLLP
jgi:hypothetical protein